MKDSYLSQFASPVSKLVRFFEGSRDRWKAKERELRKQRKLLLNQTRAVEKSRDEWRRRASTAERRVKELEHDLEALKIARPCRRLAAKRTQPGLPARPITPTR